MKKAKHNLIKQVEERKMIKLVDANRVSDAEQEIDKLFSEEGFIIFALKDDSWHQWSYKKEEINNTFIQNLLGMNKDTYVAMNTFKSPKRLISNLYGLNAIWSDLDYYNTKYKGKSYEEMIEILSHNKLIKKAPPSFYMYSGNGMYAIWLLESAYAKACLPIWRRLMSEVHKELECFGADPKSAEPAHVLRLAGSINSKTSDKAKIAKDSYTFNPKKYSIKNLSELLLPKLEYTKEEWKKLKNKKKKTKKEKESCKVKSLFNIHSLNYARMQDVQTLIELRDGNCRGTREAMLFLYRYWSNCFHKDDEAALHEIIELNNLFYEPLTQNEVINSTKNAAEAAELWENKLKEYWGLEKKPTVKKFFYEDKSGAYIYSNKKLIQELKISQEEMQHLRTIFNYEEKLRRKNEKRRLSRLNENGLNPRAQAKVDKILLIGELVDKGFKNKDIVNELNLTKGTVSKYSKEYLDNKEYYLSLKLNNTGNDESIEFTRVTDNELKLLVI